MKCPACGTRNNYYHRYCYFCGEKLGAMIDPPDQEDHSPDQEYRPTGGKTVYPAYDDDDTGDTASSPEYTQEHKEEQIVDLTSAFDYENQSDTREDPYSGYPPQVPPPMPPEESAIGDEYDTVEPPPDDIDYFGYPSDQSAPRPDDSDTREDIDAGIVQPDDYFGYPSGQASPQEEDLTRDAHAHTAADFAAEGDYSAPPSADPSESTKDAIAAIEEDISAKISSMEKYMDDYLSGRIGPSQEAAPAEESEDDDTSMYNDSLDFIHIEGEEPSPPEPRPEPRREPKPEPKPKPKPEPPIIPPPPPVPPVVDTGAGTDPDEYDSFEDEETSKMIDMLYQSGSSSQDSAYPRRSHRHGSVKDDQQTEESEEQPDNPDGNTIVKVFISLVIIALMIFAGYVIYNEWLNPNRVPASSNMGLLITHTLEANTLEDGTSGQWLTLYAPDGVSATIFGTSYPVENDKVQQFYGNDFLNEQYETAGELTDEGRVLNIIATVYSADGEPVEHKVKFVLSEPPVSLAVLSPEGNTVEVQGNTCTFEISVQPGAQLFINNIDYTDQVGPDGLATIVLNIPGTDEMPVHIRASLGDYADAEKTLTLIPVQEEESLLVLNESIPLATTATEVKLTGHVPPGATIETNLIQSGSPTIGEDGAFSLTVKIYSRPGYSVCLLQVFLDGTQVDQKEVIIDKTSTFNEYTTGPWEFSPYASYKADPELHEGYRFKIPGTVKEVISQGDEFTVCTVDANPGGTEQLIRVWFWGDFSHSAGASVTVYGNRWGNEEGVPRILAKYIVSN